MPAFRGRFMVGVLILLIAVAIVHGQTEVGLTTAVGFLTTAQMCLMEYLGPGGKIRHGASMKRFTTQIPPSPNREEMRCRLT